MPEPTEEKRLYKCTDENLCDDAEAKVLFYINDKTDFTTFNSVIFTPTFETDVEALIAAARGTLNDEFVVDQQEGETEDVLEKVEECKSVFNELMFHVKEAFPKNKNMWNQFGANDYSKVGKSAKKMMTLLEIAYKKADKEKTALIAKGYTQDKITNIQTKKDQLATERREQLEAMGLRPTATQDRIKKHNLVFNEIKKMHKAAQTIYAEDYAKLHQYDMPYAITVDSEEETPVPPSPTPAP